MTPLQADLVDICDGIDTGFIGWSTPHMRTKCGLDTWNEVKTLYLKRISAELELSEYKRKHGSDVEELRTLCDQLTRRVQELEALR